MKNEPVVIFAQGMRRSGTTILFDLMMEDRSYECFYEPLAAAAPAMGGGSGAHAEADLFTNLRTARESFLSSHPEWLKRFPDFHHLNLLNYGAPRLPELEFEPDLPPYCYDYLSFLSKTSSRVFLKFTRMHSKVHCLKKISPNAKFIHIVRDPRRVTASYLFGKNGKNRHRFDNLDHFFDRKSDASAWSSKPFSDFILKLSDYTHLHGELNDFERILMIWKYKFDITHRLGCQYFGRDYFLLNHDDLIANPNSTLDRISAILGSPLNDNARSWGRQHIRSQSAAFAAGDARWQQAFEKLRMHDTLRSAGYFGLV